MDSKFKKKREFAGANGTQCSDILTIDSEFITFFSLGKNRIGYGKGKGLVRRNTKPTYKKELQEWN